MSITKVTSTYDSSTKSYTEEVKTYAEGATLRVWNDSVRVMSDVWETALHATYWDEASQSLKTDVWVKEAKVDVTSEVLSKVEAFLYKQAYEKAMGTAINSASRIEKGSMVKVVSGRISKGAQGRVEVVMVRPYGMGYRTGMREKYGIATSDAKVEVIGKNGRVYQNYRDMVWVWAHNCEIVSPREIDLKEVETSARYETARNMKPYLALRAAVPARL